MVVGHWVDHSSRKGLNGFHIAGFAHGFGDRVDSGRAINLGNDMTSLNRGSLLNNNWYINTMFSFDLSTRSFDSFGKYLMGITRETSMVELGIGFGFTFLQDNSGTNWNNTSITMFRNNLFTPKYYENYINNVKNSA